MEELGKGISHIPWEDMSLGRKALPEVKNVNMLHKNEWPNDRKG